MPENNNRFTVTEQIDVQISQIKYMERTLPAACRHGTLGQQQMDHKLGCARATLRTLESLRALVHGEEIAS